MSLLHLAYVIARQRLLASWPLELVLFLGILLAVALLSSSVVFSDLLANAALRKTLQESSPEQVNIWVRVFNDLDDPSVRGRESLYQSSKEFVDQRVGPRFDGFVQDRNRLFETATFFFSGHPQLELDNIQRPRGKIQHMTAVGDPQHTRLLGGRWPGENPSETAPLEVALDQTGSELLQLGPGDEMTVFPATGSDAPIGMAVEVVGVFQRTDPQSEFWQGQDQDFSYQDDRWTIVPLFAAENSVLNKLGRTYPGIHTNTTWVFNLDRNSVGAADVGPLLDAIRLAKSDVIGNLRNSSISIKLDRVLNEYSEQLLLARIPLFLMVFLVTGILAYYLALVAALTVKFRNTEIAMLKSRGSTTFQIGVLVLVEGLLLAIPALALGTLVSPLVAQALAGVFFEVQPDLGLDISWWAYLLGAGGALLAVGVLSVATLVAARKGIVEFRQSGARPASAPFIHRYYLDLLVLLIMGLLWWQTQSRGSFLVKSVGSADFAIDFSLLLGPVLALLALGLLVLRIFPILVSAVARVVEPVGPAWLVQGLRKISRDPIVPGSLVVLLMLATSLGVIGSAFGSTLERSQRERAMYQAGADLWVQHSGSTSQRATLGLSPVLIEAGLVESAAEGHRFSARPLTEGFGSTRMTALAVDASTFGQVGWYRSDFASQRPLPELMAAITPEDTLFREDGIRLPLDSTVLAVWVRGDRPETHLSLRARLMDSRGQYFDVPLGDLSVRGWQRLEAQIEFPQPPGGRPGLGQPGPTDLAPPFTLLSVQVSSQSTIRDPGAIFFDSVSAITPRGEQELSDFQALGQWRVIQDYVTPSLNSLDRSQSVTRGGNVASASFGWSPGGTGLRGIRHGNAEEPMPVIVSSALLQITGAKLGDALSLGVTTFAVPVKIVAVADYFPTLDPQEEPFVVADLRTLAHYGNRHNASVIGGPDEFWVNLKGDQENGAGVISALADRGLRVHDYRLSSDLIQRRLDQPLTNASWGGLLVLMFLALVLASASGIMLFSYLDTRERQTEFALLRTLGSSRNQINGAVWFSLFVIVACGVGLGTWSGQQIGATILPVLEVAEGGSRVTPPMVLQTSWRALLVAYLVLAGVTFSTVLWLAWFTARMEVQQVLRAGEATR